MSTLKRVILEFDDHIAWIEGDEAMKWDRHVTNMAVMAQNRVGNQNPFDTDPVKWNRINDMFVDFFPTYARKLTTYIRPFLSQSIS